MASAVLTTIHALCGDMKEAHAPCERFYRRLADAFAQLQTREAAKHPLPPTDALGRYAATLRTFRDFLRRYRAKPLYARVVQHEQLMKMLKNFHSDMDDLVAVLGIRTTTDDMWMEAWEKDSNAMRRILHDMIDSVGIGDAGEGHDQVETMTVLQYEKNQTNKHSEAALALIQKLYDGFVARGFKEITSVPPWFIPRDDVELNHTPIGRGSFGAVHRGTWKESVKVVVKVLLVDESSMTETARSQLVEELNRWYGLDHPNIIKILGACHVSSPPILVYEEAEQGNAAIYLGSSKRTPGLMWRLLHEAALGLEYLHINGITHCELRLSNILVDATGTPRLSDFGFGSVRSLSAQSSSAQYPASRPGLLRWRAPECLKRKPTAYSDIYSLAMCIVEAVTGVQPFACVDDDTVYRLLRDGELFEKPDELGDPAWELVQAMAQREPTNRIPLDAVIVRLRLFAADSAAPSTVVGDLLSFTSWDEEGDGLPLEDDSSYPLCESEDAGGCVVDAQTSAQALLAALHSGTLENQECALAWLYRKADAVDDCEVIHGSDGVALLTNIITSDSSATSSKLYGFGCLQRLSNAVDGFDPSVLDKVRTSILIPAVSEVADILSSLRRPLEDLDAALRGLELATCLVDLSYESCQTVIAEGFIQQVVDVLGVDSEQLSAAVLVAIDTLAAAKALTTVTLNATSTVPKLLTLLHATEVKHQYQAMVALSSICESSPDAHELVKDGDGIVPIIAVLQVGRVDLAILAAQVLGHLSTTPSVCLVVESGGVVDELVRLTQHPEKELRVEAALALSRMSQSSKQALRRMNDQPVLMAIVEAFDVGNDSERLTLVRTLAILAEDPLASHNIERSGVVDELIRSLRSADEDQRLHAVAALASLTQNSSDSLVLIVNANGVKPLASLLKHGDDNLKVMTTRTLGNLALSASACRAIEKTSAISLLVQLVQEESEQQFYHAAIALSNLCQYGESSILQIKEARGIQPLFEVFKWRGEIRATQHLIAALASALSAMVSAGAIDFVLLKQVSAIPLLIEFLESGNGKQQCSIVQAVAILCEHIVECHSLFVEANSIKSLVSCLSSECNDTKGFAARALGFLSSCAPVYHKAMEGEGVVQEFVKIIQEGTSTAVSEAVIGLSLICEHNEEARVWFQKDEALDQLLRMLDTGSPTQIAPILGALVYASRDVLACQRVETSGVISRLVQLVSCDQDVPRRRALLVLANLIEFGSDSLLLVTEAGAVESVLAVLREGSDDTKLVAARFLERVAAYLPACQAMETTDLVDQLLLCLRSTSEELKCQSIKTLSRVCEKSGTCCIRLKEADGVERLVGELRRDDDAVATEVVKTLYVLFWCASTQSAVTEASVVDTLVAILETGSPIRKATAQQLLIDMSGDAACAHLMVLAGAVDIGVKLLATGSGIDKETALMMLPRLASSDEGRAQILSSAVVASIVNAAAEGSESTKRFSLQALGVLAGDHELVDEIIRARGVFMLVDQLEAANEEVKVDAAYVLQVLSSDDTACFRMAHAGVLPVLIDNVERSGVLKDAACKILCRLADVIWMVDDDSTLVQLLLDQLQRGHGLLKHNVKAILRALSGDRSQLVSTVDSYVASLVELARHDTLQERQAALSVLKQTAASRICIPAILRTGGADLFLAALDESDDEAATTADDALCDMMKDADGTRCLAQKIEFKDLVVSGRRYRSARAMVVHLLRTTSPLLCEVSAGLSDILTFHSAHVLSPQVCTVVDSAWTSILSNDTSHVLIQVTRLVELLVHQSQNRVGREQDNATCMLCELATYGAFRRVIVAAGGVRSIVVRLCQCDEGATAAATALRYLMQYDEDVRVQIVNGGGVGPLVEMARVGDATKQSAAIAAIAGLVPSPVAARAIRLLGGTEALEELTTSSDPRQRASSRCALRMLNEVTRMNLNDGDQSGNAVQDAATEDQETLRNNASLTNPATNCEDDGYSDSYCSGDSDEES